MRKRMGACHADNYEEYLHKLKAIDSLEPKAKGVCPQVTPYSISCSIQSMNQPTTFGYDINSGLESQDVMMSQDQSGEMELEGTFSFDAIDYKFPAPASTDDHEEIQVVSQLTVKTIVIGTKEVGRHCLVHSLVPGGSEEAHDLRNPLDLVVKTHADGERVIKYQFWIKNCDLETEIEKFASIYKVYYSLVSSLIFVYSVYDRESFTLLKKSIEEVKRHLSLDKFKGIIIGLTKEGSDHLRQVNFLEGEEMMTQEGMCGFFETDLGDNACKEKVLSFLCSRAECQGNKNQKN